MTKIVDRVDKSTTSVDYQLSGVKKIRMSDNLSALDVVGMDGDNMVQAKLKKATIGDGVVELAPSCFIGCSALVEVKMGENTVDLDSCAFMGCRSLQRIDCLARDGYQLQNIGNSCFMGCDSLTSIYVNVKGTNRYTQIGEYAFASCMSLKSAEFTGRSFIAPHMFAECSALTSVVLPPNTSYVYPYGFADIPNIGKIEIPHGVWFINDYMFQNCPSLSSVDIQDGDSDDTASYVNELGDFVFDGSPEVKDVYLPKSITSFSQIGPMFLGGSSVSAVHFAGVPDECFRAGVVRVYDKYRLGQWITSQAGSKTNPVAVFDYAVKYKIPIVIVMSKSSSNSRCKRFQDYVLSEYKLNPDWLYVKVYETKWSGGKSSNAYFAKIASKMSLDSRMTIMGKRDDGSRKHACWYSAHCYSHASEYPHVYAYWPGWSEEGDANTEGDADMRTVHGECKFNDAGTAFLVKSGGSYDKAKSAQRFGDWLSGMFSAYQPKVKEVIEIPEDSQMSLFGLNIKRKQEDWISCAYYSSTGKMFAVKPNGIADYKAQTPVDKETVTNFKWGTWYYNARELKPFADRHHIPVFVEYSSAGCRPCKYFKNNVYDDPGFQAWVRETKCLFCRIEIEDGESWSDPNRFPQPYAVDQWIGKNPDVTLSLPYLGFYWNRPDGEVRKEVKSYHFNPGEDDPPYSIADLERLVEDFISEYSPTPAETERFSPPGISSYLNGALGTVQCRYYEYDESKDITSQTLSADLTAYNYAYLTGDYFPQVSSAMSDLTADGAYTKDEVLKMASDVTARAYVSAYDSDGIFFPCDSKKELSCKQGMFALSSEDGARLSVYSKICRGMEIDVKPGVWQFYIYDGSTAYQYDADSVIFKVEKDANNKKKVKYVYSGQLDVAAGTRQAVTFQPGRWYQYTAEDGEDAAQQFIDECNANGSVYDGVIVQCRGSDDLKLLDDDAFKKYMASSKTYFGKFAATSDSEWTEGANAVARFQSFVQSVPGGWLDGKDKSSAKAAWGLPCVYVYAKCMNCGQTAQSVPIKHSVYELSKYSSAQALVDDIKQAPKTE